MVNVAFKLLSLAGIAIFGEHRCNIVGITHVDTFCDETLYTTQGDVTSYEQLFLI